MIAQNHVTERSYNFEWELLIVCQHPTKFGNHRYCDNGDKMVLVYQVISEDHMTKGSQDFTDENQSWKVTILPSLVITDIVVVEILF